MAVRTIFCLIQGRDKHTEAYYIWFEASILTAELAKCNAKTHTELNKAYADGDYEDGTKRFQVMCLIISADSDRYSWIWNNLKNITFLGTDNYQKTTTDAYDVLFHFKKLAPQFQVHAPPAAVKFI